MGNGKRGRWDVGNKKGKANQGNRNGKRDGELGERGRRVRYGAPAMLKADPWSDCNPNFAMRRPGPGAKRKR